MSEPREKSLTEEIHEELMAEARQKADKEIEDLREELEFFKHMEQELSRASIAIKTRDKWPENMFPSPNERCWYLAAEKRIQELEADILTRHRMYGNQGLKLIAAEVKILAAIKELEHLAFCRHEDTCMEIHQRAVKALERILKP